MQYWWDRENALNQEKYLKACLMLFVLGKEYPETRVRKMYTYNKKIRASHKFITRIFGYLLPGTSAVLILNLGSGMEILGMGHKKSWSGPCSVLLGQDKDHFAS